MVFLWIMGAIIVTFGIGVTGSLIIKKQNCQIIKKNN